MMIASNRVKQLLEKTQPIESDFDKVVKGLAKTEK